MKIIFLILFYATNTFACQVSLPKVIFKDLGIHYVNNCNDENKTAKLEVEIKNRIGIINKKFLEELTGLEIITPEENIIVTTLTNELRKKITSNENSIELSNNHPVSAGILMNLDHFEVKCSNCQNDANKYFFNISLNSKSKNFVFEEHAYKVTRINALIANKNIPGNSDLDQEDFNLVEVTTRTPESLFNQIDSIPYMKVNNNIQVGEKLLTTQVYAKNLVTNGSFVKVVIRNKGLEISTSARSLQNGKFGQVITLNNKNKTFQAKVIGEALTEVTF